MRNLSTSEVDAVSGSGLLPAALVPVFAVAGAAQLGWMVGSAVYRTYAVEIQDAIETAMK